MLRTLSLVVAGALLCLSPAHAADALQAEVKIFKEQPVIEFRSGDQLVTRYYYGESVAKPYFWPMIAPNGAPVTRAWPMEKGTTGETTDHVHQKSAWFCHGDVIPEGLEITSKINHVTGIDFWSETKGHGKIVCTKVEKPVVDASGVHVATTNEWRTAEGVPILLERRTIHLSESQGGRLVTLDIDLTPTDYAITFGDTKEGSMGVRVNDKIAVKPGMGNYRNAEGKLGESQVWGQKSHWCDYFGKVDDKTAGISVFDDPRNPHPATWHARGYGLMAANPFGRAKSGFPAQKGMTDLVKLAKGEHLKLRYGLFLHDGDTDAGKVEKAFTAFAPKAE